MILTETHHIKVGTNNYHHCDFLSYVNQNLYRANLDDTRENYLKEELNKKILVGLSSVCGLDFKNNIDIKPYIQQQQKQFYQLQHQVSYYNNLTLQQYNQNKPNKFTKKFNQESFDMWKESNINQLKKQLALPIPIHINSKKIKQTKQQVNKNFANYLSYLKEEYQKKEDYQNFNQFLTQEHLPKEGRAIVTISKEAIYCEYNKKIIKKNKHQKKIIKHIQIKNQNKYFISIANMDIIIESSIPKEQIKEIKIIPLIHPQMNGYHLMVIYDDAIQDELKEKDKKTNKNRVKKLINNIQALLA